MGTFFLQKFIFALLLGPFTFSVVSGLFQLEDRPDRISFDEITQTITIPETVTAGASGTPFILGRITSDVCSQANCITDAGSDIQVAVENGNLVLKQVLDYDNSVLCRNQGQRCEKTLRFTEGTSTGYMFVIILDENDNIPYFRDPDTCRFLNVDENYVTDEALCELEAWDDDYSDRSNNNNNGNIVASLQVEDEIFETQRIEGTDRFSLKLRNGRSCDYETSFSHRLTISLTDGDAAHVSTLQSIIEVVDQPDEPPVWSQLTPSTRILESLPAGSTVVTIKAIDGDNGVNDKIQYAITRVGPSVGDEKYFEIEEDTVNNAGVIKLREALDATLLMEARGSLLFEVEVTATEKNYPNLLVLTATISIIVEDVNNEPVMIYDADGLLTQSASFEFSCAETDKDFVATFTAVDKDVERKNNEYTVEWTDGNGAPLPQWFTDAIALEKSSGQVGDILDGNGETQYRITVKDVALIDYDKIEEWRNDNGFTFKVKIEEVDGSSFAEATITLVVTNENDNSPYFPGDLKIFEVQVEENQNEGYELEVQLIATDDDFGEAFGANSLMYEWEPPLEYLKFDPVTGKITVISSEPVFDYEAFKVETYFLTVSDNKYGVVGDRNVITVTLKINIQNINDEPPSIRATRTRLSVDESLTTFNEIFTLSTSDRDEDSDLNCTLTIEDVPDGSVALNWFELEDCTTVNIIGDIDREGDLKVDKDQGSYIDRVTLNIMVEDLNQVDPKYKDTATDDIRVTVSINDLNDEPPEFSFDTDDLEFTESTFEEGQSDPDSALRRKIVDITATDMDKNTQFCFTVLKTDFSDLVELDATTCNSNGRITLRRALGKPIDRETIAENPISIIVQVSDDLHPIQRTVQIKIEDINDNRPIFDDITTPTQLRVIENLNEEPSSRCDEGLQLVGTVKATDADLCDESSNFGCVTYTLQNAGDTYKGLKINMETGEITTNGCEIDREKESSFTITVWAYDDFRDGVDHLNQPGKFSEHAITIIVDDVNDNSPIFQTSPELQEITEEVGKSLVVGRIVITDADEGENAEIDFEMTDITCERDGEECDDYPQDVDPFKTRIETVDGVLTVVLETTDDFDFTNAYGLYSINFTAWDKGSPSNEVEQIYQINVADTNNNKPIMNTDYDGTEFSIRTGAEPGTIFIAEGSELPRFNATDDDQPGNPNSVIVYLIDETSSPGGWATFFEIEPSSTGELLLRRRWDFIENGPSNSFKICVKARDRGTTPNDSDDVVCYTLNVREADKPPYFPRDVQPEMTIDENSPDDATIGMFDRATNADIGEPQIYYFIRGFGDDVTTSFQLQDNTVTSLSTLKSLDREYKDIHEILIFATNDPDPSNLPPYFNDDFTDTSYKDSTSYTRITVHVNDLIDENPTFDEPMLYGGVARFFTSVVVLDNSTIIARDKDLDDSISYAITSVTANDPSLESIKNQFVLQDLGNDGAILSREFTPQTSMRGNLDILITASDKAGLTGTVIVKVFFLRDEDNDIYSFVFNNDHDFIESKKTIIERIISEAYSPYRCIIDSIDQTSDGEARSNVRDSTNAVLTTIITHFVNVERNELVSSSIIEGWLFENPTGLSRLVAALTQEGVYMNLERERAEEPVDTQQVIIYVLVAGCAVLGVVLLIMTASCYFRNRGMARKVRALSAEAGPQAGMKEKGTEETLPGTNAFALKGSNPMWTEEGDNGNKSHAFGDNESIASGGSVLVGVELEDDFKGHEDRGNPAFEDEFNSEDEDAGNMYGSTRNPAYNEAYEIEGENMYEYPTTKAAPNGFDPMASVARRNPLLALEDD